MENNKPLTDKQLIQLKRLAVCVSYGVYVLKNNKKDYCQNTKIEDNDIDNKR